MPYREHGMWEVLDILKRIYRGESRRRISKVTGRSRKTIGRYLKTAIKLGWNKETDEPNEELAASVIRKLKPGPKEEVGETEKKLEPYREEIRGWLDKENYYKKGLQLTKIHKLLKSREVEVSYSGLYRYVCKHFEYSKGGTTVRVAEVRAGELAEVDFGRLGLVPDQERESGQRVLHALVVTLVYSRHQYVHVTHRQKLEDFIEGLEDAWESFEGVPERVVIDNLKAAVNKADRYEPKFQRTFNDYAEYRGFIIDAAVVRHATGKPHVERQVPYVRENFFRGEQWINRDHVQREVSKWCLTTAGERIHGTTRKQPIEEFKQHEKRALKALEKGRFDPPTWAEPKVHPDQHVRFERALYSVPHQHKGAATKGKTVTVRGDSKLVRIYLGGEMIKVHPKQPSGGRSTDYKDYPEEKTAYAMRDANNVISKAKGHGAAIGEFTEQLLAGAFPWAKLRQAQKLLRLVEKYGAERVNAACRRALIFELINVKRVERIVEQALEDGAGCRSDQPSSRGTLIQLPQRFFRNPQSFNHNPEKEKKHGSATVPKDCS